MFQYLDNMDSAFEEFVRVAKKRIIINVPNSKNNNLKHLFHPKSAQTLGYVDTKTLKNLAEKNNLKVKIIYLSNKLNWIRKIFGDYLSGGIIGVYTFPIESRKNLKKR